MRKSSRPPCLFKIVDAKVVPDNEVDNQRSDPANAGPDLDLIEYSQNQDPDWRSMPVAFCDAESNTYIDCNLALGTVTTTTCRPSGAYYADFTSLGTSLTTC